MSFHETVLIITAITTGLIAGVFYTFTCAVSPGLRSLTDSEYLATMQSINRAILNPLFFVSFLGTVLLLPLSTILTYYYSLPMKFWYLLAASVIYIVLVFGVTIFGNVPLNNSLDKFDLTHASREQISSQRTMFENPWDNLNTIRTIASTAALILVIIACVV